MRYFIVLFAIVLISTVVDAQMRVNLNSNLDRQPIWGPTGYDRVEYYYLPDGDVYYSVSENMFYYSDGGRWIGRSSLPPRLSSFDLYNSYKVVVVEPRPYLNDRMYREKYSAFKGRHDQRTIRDSRDAKYFANKHHPEHSNWMKQQKHDKPGRK